MTITVYRASGTLPILVLPFTISILDAASDPVTVTEDDNDSDAITGTVGDSDAVIVTTDDSESDEDECLLASIVPGQTIAPIYVKASSPRILTKKYEAFTDSVSEADGIANSCGPITYGILIAQNSELQAEDGS